MRDACDRRVVETRRVQTRCRPRPGLQFGVALERAQTRALPLINKGVDLTPAVQVCCGACRTCMTANVVTVAMAGVSGVGVYISRLVRRKT